MTVFKCKMCGGALEIMEGVSVCECEYCGSKQTLPRLSNDKKNNLYDRANHFRRNNEYDKAMGIYEQILNEDPEDAESYWSLVLCRYGIEYVEDPATCRRVPTVNRAQMTSVFADENYKSALKYADVEQRSVYEAEAKEIEQIQKGILAISSKEEPFDVFICYKETDAQGRRTPDSVLANDLYHQLTQEGFKVFFARITLEDKLGSAYEPYIFAALQSAKVMVVLGTKPEYFNAVWVKNEWSRYLALIKSGANKMLVPAYKDMDPYDLPEEMSHLQAQDMSKLGFMQDLIRGIKKIIGPDNNIAVTNDDTVPKQMSNSDSGAQALVERAFLFLEDGEFARADEFCEQALNKDPKNAKAYVGKLMAERKIRTQNALSEGTNELTENNYFQKALRFAEESLKTELNRCNQMIVDRNKDIIYEETNRMIEENRVKSDFETVIRVLEESIGRYEGLLGWRDSTDKIKECQEQKEALIEKHKNSGYLEAQKCYLASTEKIKIFTDKQASVMKIKETYTDVINELDRAISVYQALDDWKDSKEQICVCQEQKENVREILYQEAKNLIPAKKKKLTRKRKKALDKAMKLLAFLGSYKDCNEICKIAKKRIRKYKIKQGTKAVLLVACIVGVVSFVDWFYNVKVPDMQCFDKRDYEAMGSPKEVKIPPYVTTIGLCAFTGCTELTNIEIPDSVMYIGQSAFEGCTGLTSIEIPDSVTYISWDAFSGCVGLTSVEIPDSMQTIERNAFSGCTGLTSVEIPDSVQTIEHGAFRDCTGLTSVEIPDSVETIASEAFSGCTGLTSIKIPDGVREIEYRAFEGCTGLTNVIIQRYRDTPYNDYNSSINWLAFYGCTSLETIEWADRVLEIEDSLFSGCTGIKSIKISDGAREIDSGAFEGCTGLTSIEIPDSVIEIGSYAFSGCTGLTSIEIPDGVREIDGYAFSGCTGLTSIEIPNGVREIGYGAFSDCTGLASVEMPNWMSIIASSAFNGCTGLTSIVIPNGVEKIDSYTFGGCTGLTSIEIPSSVTEIDDTAFRGCSSLKWIYVERGSYAEKWAKNNGYSIQFIKKTWGEVQ